MQAFLPTTKDHSVLQRVQDGTFVRTYRDGNRVYFNSSGFQTSAVDNADRIVRYSYDDQNRLTEVQTPAGESISYSYSGSKLSRITDPANRTTDFRYDFSGNLQSVHFSDNTSKRFEYNNDGLMVAEIDQKNSRREYQYNIYNRLEKVIQPDNTSVVINDSGSANLQNFSDLETQPKQYGSGADKLNESITDANGNKTVLAKDFQGYVSTIVDARGRTTTIKRDLEGRPIEITDVDGSIVQNTYDPTYGDLIKSKNVTLDVATEASYNIFGHPVSSTDPNGKVSSKFYNSKKQLIKETAPDGKFASYEYNSLGMTSRKSVYSATSELKNQISYEYNSKGQLTKQTDQNNKFSSYTYDLAGNVLTSTSNVQADVQSTTNYEYDTMNRLTKVTSPKNEATEYRYSATGELIQIKDPNDKVTTFEYNERGELIKKLDPLGREYLMTYDGNGNLLSEKDPAQNLKEYFYNQVNLVTQVQTADDAIYFEYNIKDEVTQIANKTSVINYDRDYKQRITSEIVSSDVISYPRHEIYFDYNKLDQRTLLQSNFQNISYSYNSDNYQLSGINSTVTGNYEFNYDSGSKLISITRPGSRTDYSYDIGSVLTRIGHSSSGIEKSFHEYSYDLRNYITQKRSPASTLNYSYDSNGQLISANKTENPSDNELFSFDALGNRITYNGVTSVFDNSGQRIQDDGLFTYVYDANGNIIYKSSKANGISYVFEYSALSQLKKATVTSSPLGGNILKIVEYKYDPVGRRILRQVTDSINTTKSSTKKYYYDGDDILAELDGGNNLTVSYTHSPLRPDDVLGAKFTSYAAPSNAISEGQILALSAGNVYYLKDHLNTVNEVANASGDIVQKMEYTAFGVLRSVKDGSGNEVSFANAPVRTSFTFTGREFEPELNMYYYRARYYDPAVGRFLQQDPDPGKLDKPVTFISKYVYAGNNPINFSDPTGAVFGLDDALYFLLYLGTISAAQAEFQVHNGGSSNYHQNFWNNFWVNLGISLIGIGFSGTTEFKMGWGGLYSETTNASGRAYSIGLFQSGVKMGTDTYWHELGHAFNFILSGALTKGSINERFDQVGRFYFFHGIGSSNFPAVSLPIGLVTEGSADLWTGNFGEVRGYIRDVWSK